MKPRRDHQTGDMFRVPVEHEPLPGSMDFSLGLRRLITEVIKDCPLNTSAIASRMSELVGHTITENQLHSWTAPSREAWRFPLEYLPALEVVCQTHRITAWLADLRGGSLLIGRDALNAELGRLERMRDEAAIRIKRLKKTMGGAA